jgi:hypothetical protein
MIDSESRLHSLALGALLPEAGSSWTRSSQRDFFIGDQLARIHFITHMIQRA